MKNQEILPIIRKELDEKISTSPLLLAIEGACATGKSTLAEDLAKHYECTLIRMDDFFLPIEKRGSTSEIASNIDKMRLIDEVFLPISRGNFHSYEPFLCREQKLGEAVIAKKHPLIILEGVYCLCPEFRDYFHMKVLLKAPWELRKSRLISRGSDFYQFAKEWIPREDLYFEKERVKQYCDFIYEVDG